MENEKYQPSRKITTADKTVMYMFDGKLHNWEGPALIPQGDNRKREYYLNHSLVILRPKYLLRIFFFNFI